MNKFTNEDSSHLFSLHAVSNLATLNRAAQYIRHYKNFASVELAKNYKLKLKKGFIVGEIMESAEKIELTGDMLAASQISQIRAADCFWPLQVIKGVDSLLIWSENSNWT
jgi:hypothetical protein